MSGVVKRLAADLIESVRVISNVNVLALASTDSYSMNTNYYSC